MSDSGSNLAELSQWIDDANSHRDPEAQTWGRLAKIQEEAGEVIEAFIGVTGQNPRKGVTHSMLDVENELLDVVITGLTALEHVTGNRGESMLRLLERIDYLKDRKDRLVSGELLR